MPLMRRAPVVRLASIIFAFCLLPVSIHAAPAGFFPARVSGGRDKALDCEASAEPVGDVPREIFTTVTIKSDGAAESQALPDGTPAAVGELATCVIDRLEFTPEVRNSRNEEVRGTIRLEIEIVDAIETRRLRVKELGPLIIPPRFLANPSSGLERCLDAHMPHSGVARFVVTVTVSADGGIKAMEPPAGAPEWVRRVADCMNPILKLAPGTRDGEMVEAQVSLPIVLHGQNSPGNLSYPQPLADRRLIEDAYRACYPPGNAAVGTVTFSFDVETDGSISRAKIVRGSGDELVDKTAACILPRLRFTPMKRGDRAVRASITWDLPVRPPH